MHIKLAKIFFVLLLFYNSWYQNVIAVIPRMMLMLGVPMMLMLLFHCIKYKLNIFNILSKEFSLWLLFTISSFVFGVFVAEDVPLVLSSVFTLFQHVILLSAVLIIASEDKSVSFFVIVYLCLALFCAATAIFTGDDYYRGRVSIGDLNPNTLGLLMCNGIFCSLFLLNLKKNTNILLSFSAIIVFLYVIILTGSRKSLISALLLIIAWLVFIFWSNVSYISIRKKFGVLTTLLLICTFSYILVSPLITNSVMFTRIDLLFEQGDPVREGLIQQGMQLFAENPILGIGYDQYSFIYNTYSHSTYVEILACTGIVGALTYFPVYLIIIYKLTKILIANTDPETKLTTKLMLALMAIFIFLAVGIIHFYRLDSMVMFGVLIAFCNMSLKKNKDQEKNEQASCSTIRQKTT